MHPLLRFSPLLLLLATTVASAQSYTIEVSPSEQTVQAGQRATYTITALPEGGFGASVFLRVIAPELSPVSITLDPPKLNAPYSRGATLTIVPTDGDVGVHSIVVEGKNGDILRFDTVRLTVTANPDKDRWTFYHLGNSELQALDIFAIAFDKSGAAWIGTGGGLARALPGEAPRRVSGPFATNRITALAVDNDGGVWAAGNSSSEPFNRYFNGQWTSYPVPAEIEQGRLNVRTIAAGSDGSVWFGSYEGIVVRFKDNAWTVYPAELWGGGTNGQTTDMLVTPQGDLWIVDLGGYYRYDGAFWTAYSLQDVRTPHYWAGQFALDNTGSLWATSIGEDSIINLDDPGFRRLPAPFDASDIATNSSGRFWISTASARDRWLAVQDGGSWKVYDARDVGFDPNAWIMELEVHENGTVWMGTGYGLAVLTPSGTVGVQAAESPLSSDRLAVIPNPAGSSGMLELVTKGGAATITLHDNVGRRIAVLFEGDIQPGKQSLPIDLSRTPGGAYLLTVAVDGSAPISRMILVAR